METVDRRAACLLASKTGSIRHKEIPGWMMQAVNEEKLLRLVLKTTEHAHEMGWPANACRDAGLVSSAKECRDAGFNAKECRDAGFNAKECRDGGYSLAQLQAVGYPLPSAQVNGNSLLTLFIEFQCLLPGPANSSSAVGCSGETCSLPTGFEFVKTTDDDFGMVVEHVIKPYGWHTHILCVLKPDGDFIGYNGKNYGSPGQIYRDPIWFSSIGNGKYEFTGGSGRALIRRKL